MTNPTLLQFSTSILLMLTFCRLLHGEYIPPGPLYRCPKEKLLFHPCTCDIESDQGISVSCNNTNLASMSLALNNLATFELPIETLTIKSCHIGRLVTLINITAIRKVSMFRFILE